MLKEEGGRGVEEGSRVTCMETSGDRYVLTITFMSFIECEPTCHCDGCEGS